MNALFSSSFGGAQADSSIKSFLFFWLVAHNRVNTRSLLHRKGFLLEDYHCPICNQEAEETIYHLLWDCHFAQTCCDPLIANRKKGTSGYEDAILAMESLPSPFSIDDGYRGMTRSSRMVRPLSKAGDMLSSRIYFFSNGRSRTSMLQCSNCA